MSGATGLSNLDSARHVILCRWWTQMLGFMHLSLNGCSTRSAIGKHRLSTGPKYLQAPACLCESCNCRQAGGPSIHTSSDELYTAMMK